MVPELIESRTRGGTDKAPSSVDPWTWLKTIIMYEIVMVPFPKKMYQSKTILHP